MGYPQTSIGVVGNTAQGFAVDGRFGNIYGVTAGAPAGIRKWDSWPQGLERIARGIADLGVSGLFTNNTFTYNSQEFVVCHGASNSDTLLGFALSNLNNTGSFGSSNASLAPSTNLRILAPAQLCSFRDAFGLDIVLCNTITTTKELNQVNWGTKLNNPTVIAENFSVIGSLPDGSGRNAWAFGYNKNSTACTLYYVTFSSNAVRGTVTPAQIDATWTNITDVVGISIDQTDGNLILFFSTADAVANQQYCVKLNQATAAVMWKIALSGGPNTGSVDMTKNVIQNGILYHMPQVVGTLTVINTILGTAASIALSNGTVGGYQMSEDVSGTVTVGGVTTVGGSVMWYGNWSEVSTHPSYLGNYCLTLGNHSGTNMGWRFWPNGAPSPAPVYAAPATSRKRAWSYVLDGHTFYVLDLGAQGTFLYDIDTKQWCQFITQGYVAWNFCNGCMWGQRIVGGDLLTTDVWEMLPGSSFFDNGATEIIHVVTGGIVTRNRIYHSVDSFSLACSVGQLQDQSGAATVLLSFSDDQGKTWTDMDTYALTQGDYAGEIAWLSLGSFESPGRIFKITDSGGFLRIEGADAGIDGFDAGTKDAGDAAGG